MDRDDQNFSPSAFGPTFSPFPENVVGSPLLPQDPMASPHWDGLASGGAIDDDEKGLHVERVDYAVDPGQSAPPPLPPFSSKEEITASTLNSKISVPFIDLGIISDNGSLDAFEMEINFVRRLLFYPPDVVRALGMVFTTLDDMIKKVSKDALEPFLIKKRVLGGSGASLPGNALTYFLVGVDAASTFCAAVLEKKARTAPKTSSHAPAAARHNLDETSGSFYKENDPRREGGIAADMSLAPETPAYVHGNPSTRKREREGVVPMNASFGRNAPAHVNGDMKVVRPKAAGPREGRPAKKPRTEPAPSLHQLEAMTQAAASRGANEYNLAFGDGSPAFVQGGFTVQTGEGSSDD